MRVGGKCGWKSEWKAVKEVKRCSTAWFQPLCTLRATCPCDTCNFVNAVCCRPTENLFKMWSSNVLHYDPGVNLSHSLVLLHTLGIVGACYVCLMQMLHEHAGFAPTHVNNRRLESTNRHTKFDQAELQWKQVLTARSSVYWNSEL